MFTQTFYKLRTGREFIITEPIGREPHVITICKALTKVFRGDTKRLVINIEPRSGKTELMIHFIAWCLARYPDCNFIYTSYAHNLAAKQTSIVRDIMMMQEYHELFPETVISSSTSAKDEFETTSGGSVYAVGAGGAITGRGAGIRGCERFGGGIIIDDSIKPNDATSDTIREGVNEWFPNTVLSRRNDGDNTPIFFIGQRVHEADLPGKLLNGDIDGHDWERLILPSINEDGNYLIPDNKSLIDGLRDKSPYVYASQYQQDPTPAGGSIFKESDFTFIDEPPFVASFITADTAETDKTYNDATVFSFWGLYKIGLVWGVHWIDCREIWVEPKDLENEFMSFWAACMRHDTQPTRIAIERKSTGVTLSSVLRKIPGLNIVDIERNRASGSKTARFLAAQPYIAAHQVTFTHGAKHAPLCIKHMGKITANDTHERDDIADTLSDAVDIALIKKTLPAMFDIKKSDKLDYLRRNYRN